MVGYPELIPKFGRRCPASDRYQLPQLGNIVTGVFTLVLAKQACVSQTSSPPA